MSVVRKSTPKFAENSDMQKGDRNSKKQSQASSKVHSKSNKENLDTAANLLSPFSDRTWDEDQMSNPDEYEEEIYASRKLNLSPKNNSSKGSSQKQKLNNVIKEIEQEPYQYYKEHQGKENKKSRKLQERDSEFQDSKIKQSAKASRRSDRHEAESLELSGIEAYYQDFTKDSILIEKNLEKFKNLDREEEFDLNDIKDSMKKGKANARVSYSSKNGVGESPLNNTYKEHLKKELRSNLERARSIKKTEKTVEPFNEACDSSITSFSKKLTSNRTTPRANEELDKSKFSSSKSKLEVQGKIDFINSMFEELTLGDKPKSSQKFSKTLNMDQTHISKESIPENSSSTKNQNKSKNQNSKRESENSRSYNQKYHPQNSEDEAEEEDQPEEIPEKQTKQKKSKRVLEDVTNQQKKLLSRTLDRDTLRDDQDEEVPRSKNSTIRAEPAPQYSHTKSKSMHQQQQQQQQQQEPSNEDDDEDEQANSKAVNSRRKSNVSLNGTKKDSKPPLPNKKDEDFEETHPFSRFSERFSATDSYDKKNYIEMNKDLSQANKKIHKNYEKILMNFDQSIKPILNTLKGKQSPSSTLKGKISPSNSKGSPRKSLLSPGNSSRLSYQNGSSPKQSSRAKEAEMNFSNPPFDMHMFFNELANMTQKITEAALIMQQTMEQLENFRRAEESRYVRESDRKVPSSNRKGQEKGHPESTKNSKRVMNYREQHIENDQDEEEQREFNGSDEE